MRNDQPVILNIDTDKAYNDFYASVSILFRIASFILFIAFLVYIVYSAFGSQALFSYDGFDYLVRNFALTFDEKRSDTVYSIRYNPDASRSFALIDNKLALSGNSGISIFSETGRLLCTDSFSFKSPIMLSSDKYALVYDSGNNDYVIYNSFTRVHARSTDKPIRGASMSRDGSFAIITSSDEYNSTVEVYNQNFKLINRFNKSGYVVDVDIENGRVLISTVNNSAELGCYKLEVILYDLSTEQTVFSDELECSLPLSCKMTTDGFIAVCSNESILYNLRKDKFEIHSYEESYLSDFYISSELLVLILDRPGHELLYDILAINIENDVIYQYSFEQPVYDFVLMDNNTCILTEGGLRILSPESDSIILFDGAAKDCKLLVNNMRSLYLCSSTSAPLIDISE
jgi:hypothetical protein